MNPFSEAVYEVQEATLMAGRAFRRAASKPHYIREIITQMDLIGVGSMLIIVLTGAFTGGILALNTAPTLKTFGATAKTGQCPPLRRAERGGIECPARDQARNPRPGQGDPVRRAEAGMGVMAGEWTLENCEKPGEEHQAGRRWQRL